MINSNETFWFSGTVKHDTGKAVLLTDGVEDYWIPHSQIIDSDDDLKPGETVEIEVPLWLAEEKGIV